MCSTDLIYCFGIRFCLDKKIFLNHNPNRWFIWKYHFASTISTNVDKCLMYIEWMSNAWVMNKWKNIDHSSKWSTPNTDTRRNSLNDYMRAKNNNNNNNAVNIDRWLQTISLSPFVNFFYFHVIGTPKAYCIRRSSHCRVTQYGQFHKKKYERKRRNDYGKREIL